MTGHARYLTCPAPSLAGRVLWMVMLLAGLGSPVAVARAQSEPATPSAERAALVDQLRDVHELTEAQVRRLEALLAASPVIGQGNPNVTVHPATPQQCEAVLAARQLSYENPRYEAICGAKYMAPLYDPATQTPEDSRACIDQFEFPNIPCAYPVVWVRASEAAGVCEAMDKRLCDAHEWEGACAGSLQAADYRFDLAAGVGVSAGVQRMRAAHNAIHDGLKVWSYGPEYRTGVCAATSRKSPACDGGNWATCGSNTFPVGMFPDCRSALDVYDLHGNAAEHMNLPLAPDQMASLESTTYGYTEMKGSWFIFDSFKAHEDACRWRAPFWHGSRVLDPASHHNYHLGFRCCKTVDE